jgi:hypothetical protein
VCGCASGWVIVWVGGRASGRVGGCVRAGGWVGGRECVGVGGWMGGQVGEMVGEWMGVFGAGRWVRWWVSGWVCLAGG